MKSPPRVCLILLAAAIIFGAVGCSRHDQKTSNANTSPPPATQSPAPAAENSPAAAQTTAPAPNPGSPAVAPTPTPQNPAPAEQPQVAEAPAPPPPPPPKPKTFEVPVGTSVTVRTITAMSTKTLQTGDPFQATLSAPLIRHGVVIAPRGAAVTGVVAESDPGGRVKGVASLSVQLQSIRSADGQTIRVQTNSVVHQAKSVAKRNAVRTGIAAGAGALIGGLAGGGKGAAIGAGVGGGAGVATGMSTRGAPAELPAESVLHFTLAAPLVITEVQPGSLSKKAGTARY